MIGDVIDSNIAQEIATEQVTDLRPTHLSLRQNQLSVGKHLTWEFILRSDEEQIIINIDPYHGKVLEIMTGIDRREEIMDIDWKR